MRKERFVGVRLTRDEAARLSEIAAKTQRTWSAVLRLLLLQAVVGDAPDVRLRSEGQNNGEEARHG